MAWEVFGAAFGGGLAAGLVAIALSFLREQYLMKPRLQVFVAETHPGIGVEVSRTVVVSPSNIGTQRVHVTGCGFILSDGSKIRLAENLFEEPLEFVLFPGESGDFHFELGALKRPHARSGKKFRRAFVNDRVGRTWTAGVSHTWLADLLLEVNNGEGGPRPSKQLLY